MKLVLIILLFKISTVLAITSIDEEALLISCQTLGHSIYHSCIATPPATSSQVSYCTSTYSSYSKCLQGLNAPLPMLIATSPSPYSWSPYDICRYEPAFVAMFDLCPSVI